jgi:uncharacterized membrane protein YphA (DoxX/SURF4 family)
MQQDRSWKRFIPAFWYLFCIFFSLSGVALVFVGYAHQLPMTLSAGILMTMLGAFASGHFFWRIGQQRNYLLV